MLARPCHWRELTNNTLWKQRWGRRVARIFYRGGSNNQVSTFKYIMPLVFKASSINCVFFLRYLFWIIMFRFKPANIKSAFIELTSFKSLFLVKFQGSTWDENHHLLVKLSCKRACENVDAMEALLYAFCNQYCRWARSHRGRHCGYAFYICTLLMYTNTRSIQAATLF